MAVFYDDFERANGALGGDWVNQTANTSIAGGYATTSAIGGCYNSSLSDSGRQSAVAHLGYVSSNSLGCGPLLKTDSSQCHGYVAYLKLATGTYYLCIGRASVTSVTELASVSIGTTQPYYWKLDIAYDAGNIVAHYNDGSELTAFDLTYSGGDYGGLWFAGTGGRIGDIQLTMGAAAALEVVEAVVGNYGTPTVLHLTGTSTDWTPGTPGSPTFTVDHGTITGQEVLTATTATVTYDPGAFLGTATFADPSTGATDTLLVTSDPGVVLPPGVGCQYCLTEAGANLINDSAAETALAKRLFSRNSMVGTTPIDVTYEETVKWLADFLINNGWSTLGGSPATMDQVLNELVGSYRTDPTAYVPTNPGPIKYDTQSILAYLSDMSGEGSITLAQVINILRGSGAYDLTTITELIAGGSDSHGLEILERLTEIQGPGVDTLYSLGVLIQSIKTNQNWTLGDVISRLDDRPTKLQLDAWGATIMGSLGGLALEIAGLYKGLGIVEATSIFDTIAGILSDLLTGLGESAVNAFLNKILEKDTGEGGGTVNLPLWPGEDYVEWGEAIALESNLPVVGDMHGVVVDITGCESGTRFFDYDGIRNWSHVGALAFGSDNGYQEPFQALGAAKGIYTVKTMERATYCRLFRDRLVRGTIRPWKRKANVPVLE